MKNGDIEIDKDGKKWFWTNSMFYEYDDRSRKEKMSDLPKYIENNPKEFMKTVVSFVEVLKKVEDKYFLYIIQLNIFNVKLYGKYRK